MTERRRPNYIGIASIAIALLGMAGGGLIAWGKQQNQIEELQKAKDSYQEQLISTKREIKDEIKQSEDRTRQDIQELRRIMLRTR